MQDSVKACICYAPEDRAAARRLARRLRAFRGPGFSGLGKIALSTDPAADDVPQVLASAKWLIVCCSPAAFGSDRVNAEIDEYIRTNAGSRLLLLLLNGDPREAVPARVRAREPLTADFRANADGEQLGLLKVAAGLLEMEVGVLADQKAAGGRIGAWAATFGAFLLLAAAAAATIFAAYSVQQRMRAEILASAAIDLGADAVMQADDLSLRLAELDRTSPEVLGAAEARFDRLFAQSTRSPALLRQQGELLLQFSELYARRGNVERSGERARAAVRAFETLPETDRDAMPFVRALSLASAGAGNSEALSYAERAVASARALNDADADIRVRSGVLAQALGRLAELKAAAGQQGEALALYAEAAPALEAVLQHSPPGDDAAMAELSGVLDRLGNAQAAAGEHEAARASFTRMATLSRARLDLDPGNMAAQVDLSGALFELGRAFVDAGNSAAAPEPLQESLALTRRLAAADPANAAMEQTLAERLMFTAKVLASLGRAGPQLMEEALSAARAEVVRAPNAATRTTLAELVAADAVRLQRTRDFEAARTAWREVAQLHRAIAENAPSPAIADAYEQIAITSISLNEMPAATAAYAESVRQRRAIVVATPADRSAQSALAATLHQLALVRRRAENETGARAAFAEAARIRLQLATADEADAAIAYEAADSLQQLAQTQAEASPRRARESLETARDLLTRVTEANPQERRYAIALRRTQAALRNLPAEEQPTAAN